MEYDDYNQKKRWRKGLQGEVVVVNADGDKLREEEGDDDDQLQEEEEEGAAAAQLQKEEADNDNLQKEEERVPTTINCKRTWW